MKKALVALIAIAMVASLSFAADEVKSVNVVGFNKVTLPAGKLILAALNFDEVGGAEVGLPIQLLVAEGSLSGGLNQIGGDNLLRWDPITQTYQTYFLFNSGGALPDWDNKWFKVGEGGPTADRVESGEGFWIRSNQGTVQTPTFLGQVIDMPTNTVGMVEGLNMVGYPFSSARALNDTDLGNDGTGGLNQIGGDNLLLWDSDSASYITYYLFESGGALPDWDKKWFKVGEGEPTTDAIALGKGAWYRRQSGSMLWTEPSPYTL